MFSWLTAAVDDYHILFDCCGVDFALLFCCGGSFLAFPVLRGCSRRFITPFTLAFLSPVHWHRPSSCACCLDASAFLSRRCIVTLTLLNGLVYHFRRACIYYLGVKCRCRGIDLSQAPILCQDVTHFWYQSNADKHMSSLIFMWRGTWHPGSYPRKQQ